MYQSDLQLPASCVGLLSWADSIDRAFRESDIQDRFPDPECDEGVRHPLSFWLPKLVELGYLEATRDDESGTISYKYDRPAEVSAVPEAFKAFCRNYSAAGGRVSSPTTCYNRLKKHKDWKTLIRSRALELALEEQIYSRSQQVMRGELVPPWKNLETWINNRCWEEIIKYKKDAAPPGPSSSRYEVWLSKHFGKEGIKILTDAEFEEFATSTGQFAGYRNSLSTQRLHGILWTCHRNFQSGVWTGNAVSFIKDLYNKETA